RFSHRHINIQRSFNSTFRAQVSGDMKDRPQSTAAQGSAIAPSISRAFNPAMNALFNRPSCLGVGLHAVVSRPNQD
ncbi:MAG TPA: hypothetical protein VIF39_08555, partial [Hyphomicrobium sp.]